VKAVERPTTDKVETAKKPACKIYAEMYRRTSKRKLPTGNSNVSTVCCCCSRHVNTARPKAVINRRNMVKDVQTSSCWVGKPIKSNSASIILKRYDYVDVRGRSRLEVEDESEMSLELLRLVKRQLNEGYEPHLKCLNDSPSVG
nr:hypothetical protein [Tanacetum cinerariifolium]